jgi:hypothetical protein
MARALRDPDRPSKCLAFMPGVDLVSEVNPLNRFGSNVEPTNPLLLLERSYRDLTLEEIKEDFLGQMAQALKICCETLQFWTEIFEVLFVPPAGHSPGR